MSDRKLHGLWGAFRCRVLDRHRWEIADVAVLPRSAEASDVMAWIDKDYELARRCSRCGATETHSGSSLGRWRRAQ